MAKTDREIYPNAPLQYVACEVRFPFSPSLVEDGSLPRLHKALYPWLPIVEPATETTVVFGGQPTTVRHLRFLSRDRFTGVVVTPTQVTVETTDYTQFEEFRTAIGRALQAIEGIEPGPVGLNRVGLRYIDEIRAGSATADLRTWDGLIDSKLAAPVSLRFQGGKLTSFQGTVKFETGDARRVVMRYGALTGQSVGDAPLRRRHVHEGGPYFLIDVDSFWLAEGMTPEFSAKDALDLCRKLHSPVRELFEASITERLRKEVLRKQPDGSKKSTVRKRANG